MPACRICGSDEENQYVRSPFVFGGKKEHNFWQCEKCDAIYLYPIPSEEEEKKFYLQEFEGFMSSRVGDHRDWSNAEKHKNTNQDQVKRRMPFLEKYIKTNIDLLEIGCSSGFMLDAFREMGANCIGIEPSGEFGEYLIKQGHKSYSDMSELGEKKFDLITNFFVFEHIRNPFEFLAEMYSHLKESGVIICEIPCANDPLTSVYEIDPFEKFYWSIAHHYYYTHSALKFVLNKMGYKYELVPEQRYDLSNHMEWMMKGKPGGQGKYSEIFGQELIDNYKQRLIDTWNCDTVFLYVWKE